VTVGQRLRSCAALGVAVLGLSWFAACGGSPNGPGPINPPPPPPPPVNTPPVIDSITASASRTEVDTDVTLTATVRDAETPVSQLTYAWSADAGTFTGTGATVTWRVAKGITTPVDVAIKLTVTENYGSGQQNTVSGTSPAVRVHDSPAELTSLSMGFLGDFANSSVSPSTCVRNFSDGCSGKADEKRDIESNREHFTIVNSSLRMRDVRIAGSQLSANMRVECSFTSRIDKCEPADKSCVVGKVGTVAGDCLLTGVYEQQKWWLCTSNFSGSQVALGFRSFFGRPEN
jgi:hypothetical protein